MALCRWEFCAGHLDFQRSRGVMGIVNLTPDSFSDGGRFLDPDHAVARAMTLLREGADVLDFGGESTRPGAEPISVEEELARVIPVVARLAQETSVPISVDTTKAVVARKALEAGAVIVNDISGLQFDPEMVPVCRDFQAGVICMHIQGTPQTMQDNPEYQDVVADVAQYFRERIEVLVDGGISLQRIMLDPGIGFGKTADHNLELLAGLPQLSAVGRPLLIGHSRKRFIQKLVGRPVDERLFGTIGVSLAALHGGASMVRVHDVQATRDAWVAFEAVQQGRCD